MARRAVVIAFVLSIIAPATAALPAAGSSVPLRFGVHGRAHVRKRSALLRALTATTTSTSSKALSYFGGPVIAHAKIYLVRWGTTGTFFSQVDDGTAANFYAGVTNSHYFDWLNEYDTPTQMIGRGSFGGAITITPAAANNGPTIDDVANIQPEIEAEITAHHLPAPDADTIFMIYFRQGQVITVPGTGNSVTAFCAYHNTIAATPQNVRYAVLPYQDGPGCGNDPDAWNNMTSIASHELVETVTDPDVGLAQSFAPPLSWYNSTFGEIGDLCNAKQSDVAGGDGVRYVVQMQWSNTEQACLATRVRTISIGDGLVVEGDSKSRAIKFPVTLSDPATQSVSVQYQLTGVTATGAALPGPGVDFNNRGGTIGTITFAPGTNGFTSVAKFLIVPIYSDTIVETDQTFIATLSNAQGDGYSIARGLGTATIADDDPPATMVNVSAGDASISAGDLMKRTVAIPVTLSKPSATTVSVAYSVAGTGAGTAFKAASGTLSFAAGSVSRFLSVPVYADAAPAPGEQFTVALSNPLGNGTPVSIVRATGTVSILS